MSKHSLWENGVVSGLGFLPGDVESAGNAINDAGQVVGQSCDSSGNCRGFLWQDGVMMDLNALVPPDSNLDFGDPTGINARDWVLATLGRLPPALVRRAIEGTALASRLAPMLLLSEGANWLASEDRVMDVAFLVKQNL